MLYHISNKQRDVLGGARMTMPLKFVHLCDSLCVVSMVNGKWATGDKCVFPGCRKSLRWGMYALQHQWRFGAATDEGEFLVHRVRALNSLADFYANHILDSGRDCIEYMVPCTVAAGDMLVLCTDGASRDNLGAASAGAVLHVVHDGQLHVVAVSAICLGLATSSCAEFEAACLGQTLLTKWCRFAGVCV